MLYNLVACPRRVHLDLFGDPLRRDEVSPFISMLWARGALYEQQLMSRVGERVLDLSQAEPEERERLTLEAMHEGVELIYAGRIVAEDLVGVPDLLRRESKGYRPIDIKSGRGWAGSESDRDGKPKLDYAVQLAIYVDILEQLGFSAGRFGAIWDIDGAEVVYRLDEARTAKSARTLWQEYNTCLATARSIVAETHVPRGAMAAACKLCHWYTSCSSTLIKAGDLTLIAGLGRTVRDAMVEDIPTVEALAACDLEAFFDGKRTVFTGVGQERLRTFQARAKHLTTPETLPYLTKPIALPCSDLEYFFDIEVDPLRDHCYLHGIVERRGGAGGAERFVAFFTENETPEAERDAFAQAFAFLTREPSAVIFYYSKYERTIYRQLQARYPDVCSAADIGRLFDPRKSVDLLYDVVMPATEWPLHDRSIKTLAKYLGFSWRDSNPSGAASIEWFDRWVRTRDPAIRQRILDYNEDDCRATRVLLDGIREIAGADQAV